MVWPLNCVYTGKMDTMKEISTEEKEKERRTEQEEAVKDK